MEKQFTSDEKPLGDLLAWAERGQLQLPDFQRGWVWSDTGIASLLASVSMTYPIGAVMTLRTGNPEFSFQPRPLEGVSLDDPVDPEFLLLDGQQRCTSLFLALKSRRPVPTRDDRNRELERRYFADMAMCIDPDADREDAIVSLPADGVQRTFRGSVVRDASTREAQIAAGLFPLDIVLDSAETNTWGMAYMQDGGSVSQTRFEQWQGFLERLVTPFQRYEVPTIELGRQTTKDAVCQVFEKVNTGGVSLTVFELLTATFAGSGFQLREDWEARERRFRRHGVLEKVEQTQFLQIVTLLATYARDSGAVACKRRDLLKLELSDYEAWAEPATQALERVVPFLHSEHIFAARDVPYPTQVVPLAAITAILGAAAEAHGAREKLARWFWCGVLGEMYGGSTETRFAFDVPEIVAWVRDAAPEPRTVRDAQFQADRLMSLRTRNSAAYKGLHALQMKRGALDFRTGHTIDVHAYVEDAIDIHHIFPQHWCEQHGVDRAAMDSIANKTALAAHTNRRIGGRAPSRYLRSIESVDQITTSALDEILRSHDIEPMAMRRDDFGAFFVQRFERLVRHIEAAMGKTVNRSPDGTDHPYGGRDDGAASMQAMLEAGESATVEFKSTGRKNRRTGDKDARMEWAVVKSIAGFMNAKGGTLLIGVADDGSVVGVEEDFSTISKAGWDGWTQWLANLLATSVGKAAAAEIAISAHASNGRIVARLDVGPAATPVFAHSLDGPRRPVFLVRVASSTQELAGDDMLTYQRSRWPGGRA